MSFSVSGIPLSEWTRLTGNTATTIYTATRPTTIISIGWSETAGGTHTLSIVRNDGTNDHILRGGAALTAYEHGVFDEVIRLKQGDTLKATSGDVAGKVDLRVTYLAPDASVQGNR